MGDLYAGLYPTAKVIQNPGLAKRKSILLTQIRDRLADAMKEKMKVANVIRMEGAIHQNQGAARDHSSHDHRRNKILEVL